MYYFIDDMRAPEEVTWVRLPTPPDGNWKIIRDYEQWTIELNMLGDDVEFVSFDHDLADVHYGGDYSEKTGKHCAQALIDWCIDTNRPLPTYMVHSMNPVGRENILSLLDSFKAFQQN